MLQAICFIFMVTAFGNLFSGDFQSAVTSGRGGSHLLGDRLLHYVKAKWVSYKYGIPLLYKPFRYSDKLVLHSREKHFSENIKKRFKGCKGVVNEVDVSIKRDSGILYETDLQFKGSRWENARNIYVFAGLIDDSNFIAELKSMIRPRVSFPSPDLPSDRITVAVHVRKGRGNDPSLSSTQIYKKGHADEKWPYKFPPDQYYIDQIINLSEMLGDKPLYVHIFTDHSDPKGIVDRYKRIIGKKNITYSCREGNNRYEDHILEDFFAMGKFDCLIRPCSNFSQIADLVGENKIVIYPKHATWEGGKLIINEVGIAKKGLLEKLFSV